MSRLIDLKVLIVEDEPEIRAVLIEMIGDLFAEINAVTDGHEALLYLKNKKIDLLLTDIQMPRMGGFELIRKIQEENLILPTVILLSGQVEITEQMAIDSGAKGLMHKPYKIKDLILKINSLF